MATKDELKKSLEEFGETIKNQNTEIEELNDSLEEFGQTVDIQKTEIDYLKLELKKAIVAPAAKPTPKKEPTTKLYWKGHIDTSVGSSISAFGFALIQDKDGNWYADIPESRVEGELARSTMKDVSKFSIDRQIFPEDEMEVTKD